MGLICRNNGNEQIGYVTLLLGGTVVNFYFEGVCVDVDEMMKMDDNLAL